jgi:hypothetical protein
MKWNICKSLELPIHWFFVIWYMLIHMNKCLDGDHWHVLYKVCQEKSINESIEIAKAGSTAAITYRSVLRSCINEGTTWYNYILCTKIMWIYISMSLEDIIRVKYNHLKYINVSRAVFSNIHCNWVTAVFNNVMTCKLIFRDILKWYAETDKNNGQTILWHSCIGQFLKTTLLCNGKIT